MNTKKFTFRRKEVPTEENLCSCIKTEEYKKITKISVKAIVYM